MNKLSEWVIAATTIVGIFGLEWAYYETPNIKLRKLYGEWN